MTQANAKWDYRRDITIGSTVTKLINYQILVELDPSNFSYGNSDGTDGHDLPNIGSWLEEKRKANEHLQNTKDIFSAYYSSIYNCGWMYYY